MAYEAPEFYTGGIIVGIEKLVSLAALLAALAASTGRLPRIIYAIHMAELRLLKESQASKWPKAELLLPVK